MKSLAIRSRASEQMDAPDLPPAVYRKVLADLAKVNTLTLARRPTLRFVRFALAGRRTFRLLDVGFGDGDMLRSIARSSRRDGVDAHLTGIDLNPGSAPAARAVTPRSQRIAYRTGDYATLAGRRFDLVISSLVAHHMDDDELVAFLRFMEAEARLGWMVNDLHRHWLAYAGFPILARAMRWHRIVRADGTLSIARSFRRGDWRRLLDKAGIAPDDARIVRRFPFRLCVERIR